MSDYAVKISDASVPVSKDLSAGVSIVRLRSLFE
jgi:hypothetical protein